MIRGSLLEVVCLVSLLQLVSFECCKSAGAIHI